MPDPNSFTARRGQLLKQVLRLPRIGPPSNSMSAHPASPTSVECLIVQSSSTMDISATPDLQEMRNSDGCAPFLVRRRRDKPSNQEIQPNRCFRCSIRRRTERWPRIRPAAPPLPDSNEWNAPDSDFAGSLQPQARNRNSKVVPRISISKGSRPSSKPSEAFNSTSVRSNAVPNSLLRAIPRIPCLPAQGAFRFFCQATARQTLQSR